MLALVNKKSIIIAGLILLIVLVAEPVSAKRAPEKASRSSQNNKRKKQNKKNIDVNKVKKASKVKRNNKKASLRSTRGKRKSNSSALPKQSKPGKIKRRAFRQSPKASARAKTNSKIIRRPITSSPTKSTRPPSVSPKSPATRRKPVTSSKAPKKVVVKSENRKSSNKPVHIVRQARRQRPSDSLSHRSDVSATSKTAVNRETVNNKNKVSKSRKIILNKPVKNAQTKPEEHNARRRSRISSERKKKIFRRPQPKKKDRITPSTPNDSRKSSLFTRPASEKRRFTRQDPGVKRRAIKEDTKIKKRSPGDGHRKSYRNEHRRHRFGKRRRSRVVFHERNHVAKHRHHHEHVYRDWHNRLCHRIVWPRYRFHVYYNWGRWFTFRYCYPYYHRKYIFVSLSGYWPVEYDYVRYYWYGYHPYNWYGYYPVAREVKGDTHNYYTYNYYYDNAETSETSLEQDGIKPVDHSTFADIREKLAQQAPEEPAPEAEADRYFDEGVKAFEVGDYETAAEKFAEAMSLAPEDIVLPFAYAQALFANKQYSEAAEVLRTALANITPEEQGVFFPRGLYPDEEILLEQIAQLAGKAELHSFDSDLQLLLGYQLLGIDEIDAAVEPLHQAQWDWENSASAEALLELVEKIRAQETDDQSQ